MPKAKSTAASFGDLDDVRFVYLDVPAAVLRSRLEQRSGHFAGVDIFEDQLRDLEAVVRLISRSVQAYR